MIDNEFDNNFEHEESSEENVLPIEEQDVDENSLLVKEVEAQKEKYIRLLAEFENFKRRTARERIDLFKTAGQEVIIDLLPALDDIDRAEQAINDSKDFGAIKEGLKLISDKIRSNLSQKGLKEIECLGKDFDTDFMEAITEIEASKDLKGKVVDVLEKGYNLNNKIIRYAKVVIGK